MTVTHARAQTQTSTRSTPDFFKALASSLTVVPVVMTSSTMATCWYFSGLTTDNAFLRFLRRCLAGRLDWCWVMRWRLQLFRSTGISSCLAKVLAISMAWLKPRSLYRDRCSGTGIMH